MHNLYITSVKWGHEGWEFIDIGWIEGPARRWGRVKEYYLEPVPNETIEIMKYLLENPEENLEIEVQEISVPDIIEALKEVEE
ncbi:hypothetical protein [Companilactobacillus metriopterae]|uniref:hypothetical protein n=1 Tax=Companilactobacillus metriopterae TaxID=1909267 RepID=UPI00100BA326|nr:hypothetical protein [Companilactobacillus metriopterae]